MKDKLPKLSKSNVIYNFACPGCQSSYIGITNRTLFVQTKEHASRNESAISVHLNDCSGVKHIYDMFNSFGNDVDVDDFKLNIVRDNTSIIDQSTNWNILLLKEAQHIKEKKPNLNNGIKASREFRLF